MMIKQCALVISFIFCCFWGNAQINDAGAWTQINVNGKLFKKVSGEIEAEARFNENWTQLATYFADFGADYKVSKMVRLGLTYRFGANRNSDGTYDPKGRMAIDLKLRDKWNGLKVSYRLRTQFSSSDLTFREEGVAFGTSVRNKLAFEYKVIKKTYAWCSGELWASQDDEVGVVLSDWRIKLGVDRKVKKDQYLTIGYLFQKELTGKNRVTDYVVLVGYKFNL